MRWAAREEKAWTYRDEAAFYMTVAKEAESIARTGAVLTPAGPLCVTDKGRRRAAKVAEKMRRAGDLVLQAGRYRESIERFRAVQESST